MSGIAETYQYMVDANTARSQQIMDSKHEVAWEPCFTVQKQQHADFGTLTDSSFVSEQIKLHLV